MRAGAERAEVTVEQVVREFCLMLARDTKEIYAKMALIELAREFRILAEDLERRPRGQ